MKLKLGYWGITTTNKNNYFQLKKTLKCSKWILENSDIQIVFIHNERHIEPILDFFLGEHSKIKLHICGEILNSNTVKTLQCVTLSDFYIVTPKISINDYSIHFYNLHINSWLSIDRKMIFLIPVRLRNIIENILNNIGNIEENYYSLTLTTAQPHYALHSMKKRPYNPILSKRSEILSNISFYKSVVSSIKKELTKIKFIKGERESIVRLLTYIPRYILNIEEDLFLITGKQEDFNVDASWLISSEYSLQDVNRIFTDVEALLNLLNVNNTVKLNIPELPIYTLSIRKCLMALYLDLITSFGKFSRVLNTPLFIPTGNNYSIDSFIPIIKIPRYSTWRIGIWPVIAHEIGHLKIGPQWRANAEMRKIHFELSNSGHLNKIQSLNQVIELLTDLVATRVMGPAYLYSLVRVLPIFSHDVLKNSSFDILSHPPINIRIFSILNLLKNRNINVHISIDNIGEFIGDFEIKGFRTNLIKVGWNENLINYCIKLSLKVDDISDFNKKEQENSYKTMSILESGDVVNSLRPIILINGLWECVFDSEKYANEMSLFFSLEEWYNKNKTLFSNLIEGASMS